MKKSDIQQLFSEKLNTSVSSLAEDEAKKIFNVYHIPVIEERAETDPGKVGKVCQEIGFPVVIKGKGEGSAFLHKSDTGLVHTAISNPSQADHAVQKILENSDGHLDGFIIQPMAEGRRELMAGMFRDPQFGPIVLLGLGGVLTEALNDVVFKVAPVSDADMEDMFDQLVSQKVLLDFRGEKRVHQQTLKTVLKALGEMALKYPQIKEIDINPLIVQPDGEPVAVDGLIILEAPASLPLPRYPVDLDSLGACYYPKSIAFIGASGTPGKWGHMLLINTLSRNYKGRVYLVNPKDGTIAGQKVFRSVNDIEGDIELVVVTIPAALVKTIIPDLKRKKVKGMLLITSGFRETGKEGATLEDDVMQAAWDAGITVLGPNTMGMCNPHIDFYCSAAHAFPIPGSTALVCQSGNMGAQLLAFADQQDIGIRAFSGSGNEGMVTIEDYMEAFEIDELTQTVVLYIESIKDGRRFFKSASQVSKQKPVVVLKGGRTSQGEKAAASHTGAMASDGRVFDAACRQAGIIQVGQPMELLDLSAVFSSLPLPEGNRVAIMTLGGGWGVITTDLCTEQGLKVPQLPQSIIDRLNPILPPYWSHGNPVDIVGERDFDLPKICLEELMKWDGCDAVIHLGIHGRKIMVNNMIRSANKADPHLDEKTAQFFRTAIQEFEDEYTTYVAGLTEKYQKPILGVSLLTDADSRTLYRVEGCQYKAVFFPSPERAVKALSGMQRYAEWLRTHKND